MILLRRGCCFQSQIMLIFLCIMHACAQYFTFVSRVACSSSLQCMSSCINVANMKEKIIALDIKASNDDHWDFFSHPFLTMDASVYAWLKMLLTEALKLRQYATATVFSNVSLFSFRCHQQTSLGLAISKEVYSHQQQSVRVWLKYSTWRFMNKTGKHICLAFRNLPWQASLSSTDSPFVL